MASTELDISRRTLLVFCVLAAVAGGAASAAGTTYKGEPERLSLASLDAFRSPTSGWSIVGRAYAERPGGSLRTETGNGTLLFDAAVSNPAPLMTDVELGDVLIELEFMVGEGSCAVLLVQGRYELRLCDSLGSNPPNSYDSGGIRYGDSGVPPLVNAARSPGLWQKLTVDFRAPRFDASGRKTASARLERVQLNGETIHTKLDLPQPSPEAVLSGEAARGPVALRGGEGRIAFRNIAYYDAAKTVALGDLRYAYYEGDLDGESALSERVPDAEGDAAALSAALAETGNDFVLQFAGTLEVPEAGRYGFRAVARGEVTMAIGEEAVLEPSAPAESPLEISLTDRLSGELKLKEGSHPFTLEYRKARPGTPALSVFVEGPGIRPQPITSEEGRWEPMRQPAPIQVEPGERAEILRTHLDHRGRKILNAVSVGDPAGVHYSLDLEQGALLQIWRGPFLDAGPIWTSRGEDPETRMVTEPRIPESRITFSGRPAVAFLERRSEPWPDEVGESFRRVGYTLGEQGRPTFRYRLGEIEVRDRLRPASDGRGLSRELTLSGEVEGETVWVLLAEGAHIEQRSEEVFSISDEFFMEVPGGANAHLRRINGRDEFLLPVRLTAEPATVRATFTW